MSSDQNLPIARGEYDANLSGYAGHQYVVDDVNVGTSPGTRRTEHQVTLRLVKNSSGISILGKRTVVFKAGTNRTEIDGYARTTATDGKNVVATDEYLPTAGVPTGSYFFVVVHGPAMLTTPPGADANNLIPEETVLVALTAAASTHSTTAGRLAPQDLTGATAVLGNQINGAFARALSAKTTANTDVDILVFMSNRWD